MTVAEMTPQEALDPITLTPAAEAHVTALLKAAEHPVAGVRLSTPKTGCSGYTYAIDYVDKANPGDRVIEIAAGTLFIDSAALPNIKGTVMDWHDDDFSAGFVFRNPNATGACGCGGSFAI